MYLPEKQIKTTVSLKKVDVLVNLITKYVTNIHYKPGSHFDYNIVFLYIFHQYEFINLKTIAMHYFL